jgi:hypothetical protein
MGEDSGKQSLGSRLHIRQGSQDGNLQVYDCVRHTQSLGLSSCIYSDRVPPPPGVMVAARRMTEDENDEPHYGERIPYVITRGAPYSRLVDRAMAPEELLNNRYTMSSSLPVNFLPGNQTCAHRCRLLHYKGSDPTFGAHIQSCRRGRERLVRRDAEVLQSRSCRHAHTNKGSRSSKWNKPIQNRRAFPQFTLHRMWLFSL